MGLLDNFKAKLGPARDRVSDLAQQHEDKIDKLQHGIDRAARVVDEKTKGKYSDKIQTGTGKAKDAMDRFVHPDATDPSAPPRPGDQPPAP
ncbi:MULTISPECIES: antitoxin [unclassified Streptomyces]|uniref:antitoxin n=1 Tax=unclassified Streptomyces TaxID=2593676 RepID=UPI00342D9E29